MGAFFVSDSVGQWRQSRGSVLVERLFVSARQPLNDAGCNFLQKRPSDPPPTPKLWI